VVGLASDERLMAGAGSAGWSRFGPVRGNAVNWRRRRPRRCAAGNPSPGVPRCRGLGRGLANCMAKPSGMPGLGRSDASGPRPASSPPREPDLFRDRRPEPDPIAGRERPRIAIPRQTDHFHLAGHARAEPLGDAPRAGVLRRNGRDRVRQPQHVVGVVANQTSRLGRVTLAPGGGIEGVAKSAARSGAWFPPAELIHRAEATRVRMTVMPCGPGG
jgi:hypothetical protein